MKIEEIRKGFDKLVANVGEVAPSSSTPFSFDYSGTVPIWGVTAACGCTNVRVEDGSIIGTYNAGTSPGTINKSITVFFDDGQDMYTRDERKNATMNPNKLKILLTVIGEIK